MNTKRKTQTRHNAQRPEQRGYINFDDLNDQVIDVVQDLVNALVPDVDCRVVGNELEMINPHRLDGDFGSFKFNLQSGLWSDFADEGVSGRGAVHLIAYLKRIKATIAAREIQHWLDEDGTSDPSPSSVGSTASSVTDVTAVALPSLLPGRVGSADGAAACVIPEGMIEQHKSVSASSSATDFVYRSPRGEGLMIVTRQDMADGTKRFSQHSAREIGGRATLVPKAYPTPRPLYGLDLLAAAAADAPIVLVEGEKACHAFRRLYPDVICMTHSGGANAVGNTDFSPLRGRQVLVWPDFDDAGAKCAAATIKTLRECGVEQISQIDPKTFWGSVDAELGRIGDLSIYKGNDAADLTTLGLDPGRLLELARAAITAESAGVKAQTVEATQESWNVGGVTYVSDRDGVRRVKIIKDDVVEEQVCSPLKILGFGRSVDAADWSLVVEFPDPDGNVITMPIQRSMLANFQQKIQPELAANGLIIFNAKALETLLTGAAVSGRYLLAYRPGWQAGGRSYLLGRQHVGLGQGQAIMPMFSVTPPFAAKGSLAAFNESVVALCVGHSRLTIAMGAALAGPMLTILGIEGGGLHLYGPSSIGKTTALRVAASIYGSPSQMVRSWRATSNSLESVAEAHNDALLILDEVGQGDGAEAGETAYMLANGRGKSRMSPSITLRRIPEWKLLFLSSGELDLERHMAAAGARSMAGQDIRMLSVPADAGVGLGIFDMLNGSASAGELAERLARATEQEHGTVIEPWVEYLLTVQADAVAMRQIRVRFDAAATMLYEGDEGQVRRVANRFALILVALELASQQNLVRIPVEDIEAAVTRCFGDWLAARGGPSAGEERRLLRQVASFLQRHAQSRFIDIGGGSASFTNIHEQRVAQLAGYRRFNSLRSDFTFDVLTTVFNEEVITGFDPRFARRVLIQRGLLLPNRSESTHTRRIPGQDRAVRFYVLTSAAMGADEPEVGATADLTDVSSNVVEHAPLSPDAPVFAMFTAVNWARLKATAA